MVERTNVANNKRKENNDAHLKGSLIEKWNEYLSTNDELADRKKCLDDIDKEILKIQNDLDVIFRQREPSAGKSKTKIDCDKKKHEELLENKLHVVRFLYYIIYIYIIGNVDNRAIIIISNTVPKRYHCLVNVIIFFFFTNHVLQTNIFRTYDVHKILIFHTFFIRITAVIILT